jgi:hypothetical protein
MTRTHKVSLVLSGLALLLFVANEFYVLAGWGDIPLHGPVGSAILTGFFALGLVIQLAKFVEGHKSPIDLVITLLMLFTHVASALTVWGATKIFHIDLPVAELPYYIVGLYWVIGIVEVMARYMGRELKLFSRDYKSPEQRLMEMENKLALAEQTIQMERRQREIAEQREERSLSAPKTLSLPVSAGRSQTTAANADPEQIKNRIRSLLSASPNMSKSEMARQLNIARSTLYTYLPDVQTNGHHKAEVN